MSIEATTEGTVLPPDTGTVIPQAGEVMAQATPAVTPATATTTVDATPGLNPELAQHLQSQWGVDPTMFKSPQQIVDWSMQSAVEAQQARERLAQYEAQLQHQYQQPTAPTQADTSKPASPWNPPEFDERWMAYVEFNPETRLYQSRTPGSVSPDVIAKVNARAMFEEQWQQEFKQNPYEFIKKGLQGELESIRNQARDEALQAFRSQQEQMQVTSVAQNTVATNAAWIYESDSTGRPLRSVDGTPVFTQKGRQYVQAVQQLQNSGVTDIETQHRFALAMAGGAQASGTPDRASAFVGTPVARNLADTLHTQSRNGAYASPVPGVPVAGPHANSFMALAAEAAAQNGIPFRDTGSRTLI